jgi:MoxR-like ATPase
VGYPDEHEELAMLRLSRHGLASITLADVAAVVDEGELARARDSVDATAVDDEVLAYVGALVRETRRLPSVELGASPRAAVHLLAAAKAAARLAGRDFTTPDDVATMARPVLAHRLVLSPEAELDRQTPEGALDAALAAVPVPR